MKDRPSQPGAHVSAAPAQPRIVSGARPPLVTAGPGGEQVGHAHLDLEGARLVAAEAGADAPGPKRPALPLGPDVGERA